MRTMPWAVCLWPGLPQLWRRGAWTGLAFAAGFTLVLNAALLASLVWTDWLGSTVRTSLWWGIIAIWCCSSASQWWNSGRPANPGDPKSTGDLFPHAQDQYLKGNWLETERLLHDLLDRDETDAEAALMLATLYRHTGRWDEADAQLEKLARRDAAARWRMELEDEYRRLAEERAAGAGVHDAEAPQKEPSAELDDAA